MNLLDDFAGRYVKVFFVDVDDDDRERVLWGLVRNVEVKVDRDYSDIHSDYSMLPVARYMDAERYSLSAEFVPSEDGTYIRYENFVVENDELAEARARIKELEDEVEELGGFINDRREMV